METLTFEQLPLAISRLEEKLCEIETLLLNPNGSPANGKLLTVKDAAKFIHLSESTIYRLVGIRGIPYSKKAKRLYFLEEELREWIKAGRKSTVNEVLQFDPFSSFKQRR